MEHNATRKREGVPTSGADRQRASVALEAPAPPGSALTRLRRLRIGAAATLWGHIAGRRWATLMHAVAWYLPDWLFRFNQGSLMFTTVRELPHRRSDSYRPGLAEVPDMDEVGAIIGYPAAELIRRLDQGGCCLVTRDVANNNRIINVQWFHRGDCYVRGLGLRVQIGNTSGYTYGSFTIPEYRLRGVFQTALNDAIRLLSKDGVKRVFCLIESHNETSHRLHVRLGYRIAAEVTHVAILGVKLTQVRDNVSGNRSLSVFLHHPDDIYLI